MERSSLKRGIILITYGIVLYLALSHLGLLADAGSTIMTVLRPVTIGVVLAYIINLLMRPMETRWLAGCCVAALSPSGPLQAGDLHRAFHFGCAGAYHRAVLFHSAAGGREPDQPGQQHSRLHQ